MIQQLKKFWTYSIKRQLILGIALVHAIMMTLFVFDLISNEKDFLTLQHEKKTKSLSQTIAASSTSWVLANDFIGLQEVIGSVADHPDLDYVMIVNTQGQVLVHSHKQFIGKYLTDTKSKELLTSTPRTKIVFENQNYIDVASPVLRDKQHIGWVRIALNKKEINQGLYDVTFDGVLYTFIAILIGVIFAYYMAVGLIKGIQNIIDVIQKTKEGDSSARTNLKRHDEIGILSKEFDNMLTELSNQHNLISSVIESTPDLVFYKDYHNYDGIYIGCNDAFSKFVGKSKDEIIGSNDYELFDKEVAQFFRTKDKEMLELKDSNRNEEWVKYPDGKEYLLDTLKTPLYNVDGSIMGVLGVARDITEKYKAQQELHEKNELLFEQTKLVEMGEMIGNIAHQWRQPLSIISTASTGTLLEKDFGTLTDETLRSNLNLINDNAQYLSKTIDTFRDFIKEKKEYKEVILQETIQGALEIVQAALDNNHIKLYTNINETEHVKLTIVSAELKEAIINILNNAKDALKEQKPETPWIKLDLEISDNHIVISIEDNAGGIPEKILPKIFDPYFTTKHSSVGTGLGLHMSYRIVTESLNGKLYVNNTENGAIFFIDLPL